MSSARSFMVLAAVFLLFIGACSYAAEVARTIEAGARISYALNSDRDRKVKTMLSTPGEEHYSGVQVAYMIRNIAEDKINIEVNGVLYVYGSDYESMDPAQIDLNLTYRADYYRDTDGSLNKIVFRS
ncbi:hypothetical protein [Saccharibacillus kuerlensis]|uniref:Uncharacterized protein n=1 Tax=Saccharibacillus kuerlensis TaxID=459527 RepID=A0ABQ2LBB6_9BACL|nr:hypothetical protein [Saccharibacillus kuerlensis]GGO07245.1 hypothetical protein GCM10010969_35540 [Saccharibacillus kuerlensis]